MKSMCLNVIAGLSFLWVCGVAPQSFASTATSCEVEFVVYQVHSEPVWHNGKQAYFVIADFQPVAVTQTEGQSECSVSTRTYYTDKVLLLPHESFVLEEGNSFKGRYTYTNGRMPNGFYSSETWAIQH